MSDDRKRDLRAELERLLALRCPHSVVNDSYQAVLDYKDARTKATRALGNPRSTIESLGLAAQSMRNYETAAA